jgi:uncharacterized surface protein with fasciclin (FAS1) repeats
LRTDSAGKETLPMRVAARLFARITTLLFALLLAAQTLGGPVALQAQQVSPMSAPPLSHPKPIYDTTSGSEDLDRFAQWADAAGLKEVLRNEGPLTAFVPTNRTIERLRFEGTVSQQIALLQPENRQKYAALVRAHVVRGLWTIGRLKAAAKKAGNNGLQIVTLAGEKVTIFNTKHGLLFHDVVIIESDIACANGMIHPVHGILQRAPLPSAVLPPIKTSGSGGVNALTLGAVSPIYDIATKSELLSDFAVLSEVAGLKEMLRTDGPFTAFIPTGAAIADALSPQRIRQLIKPENREVLTWFVGAHIVHGQWTIEQLKDEARWAWPDVVRLSTLSGKPLILTLDADGALRINGVALRVETDIHCTNGIIHPLDRFLSPSYSDKFPPKNLLGPTGYDD